MILAVLFLLSTAIASEPIAVGSKAFTEGYLMGELVSQALELRGYKVERKLGLGGTGIVFQALKKEDIDLYIEYTGTISEAILKKPELKRLDEIDEALALQGLTISKPLGFSNNYALAVRRKFAEEYGLVKISDLTTVKNNLRAAFSHEFVTRKDGLRGLQAHYGNDLIGEMTSMEHSLAYQAMENGSADLLAVYTTDAKIKILDLVVLEDDLSFFPDYQAVILTREDFIVERPQVWEELMVLMNSLTELQVRELNGAVDLDKKGFAEVIRSYLGHNQVTDRNRNISSVWKRTKEHTLMVLITLCLSLLVGIPMGILASYKQKLGQSIVLVSSLFQTIPSLALLCFLIPLFGIGTKPALVALFMYGLLPIVVSTTSGLNSVDKRLLEISDTLGFSVLQRILRVELPLASPQIITGVRTAAIITVATATLAALIGAGGYGVPIVRGLAINDMNTILLGAIPAAMMSICVHFLFEGIEKVLIPSPLRRKN